MDDIKFIRDDVQEKKVKQLQEVLDILSVKPKNLEIEAAKRFFFSMLKATQKIAATKREKSEKEKKLRELEEKRPPEPRMIEPSMHRILQQATKPMHIPPPVKLPKIQEISEPSPLKEFKEPEPQIEEVIKSLSENYPLMLFKNIKGEVISQTNIIHQRGKILYELTEPEVDLRIVEETKKLIQKKFLKDKKVIKDDKFLTKNIKKAFKKLKIEYTDEYKEEIKYFLYKDMVGLGRIDPLIHDPNVKTIMCDGLNKPVKITLGPGLEIITNIIYTKKEELDEQIKHLGLRVKQDISENDPIADGMFYNFKIQATLGLGEAESKFMIKKMP